MLYTDGIELMLYAKNLLECGYNPKEYIFFFNPKDYDIEIMKKIAKNLGDIEIEPIDYLIDKKIYILKKKDIDQYNLTWDKYGNRIKGEK